MSGLQTSQLNRAIASGADEGIFSLPKGPSGKVKLAPKVKSAPAKEVSLLSFLVLRPLLTCLQNAKPASTKATTSTKAPAAKKAVVEKAVKPAAKPVTKKKATATKVAATKKTSAAKTEKKQVCMVVAALCGLSLTLHRLLLRPPLQRRRKPPARQLLRLMLRRRLRRLLSRHPAEVCFLRLLLLVIPNKGF